MRKTKKERKKEDGEMGSFLKHQNSMKMFIMLLVLGISKEDFTVFLKPLQAFRWFLACAVIGCFTNFLVDLYCGS